MTDRKKELIKNMIFTFEFVSNKEEYTQKLKQTLIGYVPDIKYISLDDVIEEVLSEIIPIYDIYFTEEQLEELHIMLNSEVYKIFHNSDIVDKMKEDSYKVSSKVAMKLIERIHNYQEMKKK